MSFSSRLKTVCNTVISGVWLEIVILHVKSRQKFDGLMISNNYQDLSGEGSLNIYTYLDHSKFKIICILTINLLRAINLSKYY